MTVSPDFVKSMDVILDDDIKWFDNALTHTISRNINPYNMVESLNFVIPNFREIPSLIPNCLVSYTYVRRAYMETKLYFHKLLEDSDNAKMTKLSKQIMVIALGWWSDYMDSIKLILTTVPENNNYDLMNAMDKINEYMETAYSLIKDADIY